MTKPECPINLICELMECNPQLCKHFSNPWPLPYTINPYWLPGVNLLVNLLDNIDDPPEQEYLFEAYEEYNSVVSRIKEEVWLAGWCEAIDLPYKPHPEGGLLVTHSLQLDEDSAFKCDLDYNHYDEEQFSPAVSIDAYEQIYGESASLITSKNMYDENGFLIYWILDSSMFEEL